MKIFWSQFTLVFLASMAILVALNNLSIAGKGEGCGCDSNNQPCTGKDNSGNECKDFKCVKSSTQSRCVY